MLHIHLFFIFLKQVLYLLSWKNLQGKLSETSKMQKSIHKLPLYNMLPLVLKKKKGLEDIHAYTHVNIYIIYLWKYIQETGDLDYQNLNGQEKRGWQKHICTI